jgi:hypothetical protein
VVSDALLPSGPLRNGAVPITTPSRSKTTTPVGAPPPDAALTIAVSLTDAPTNTGEEDVESVVLVSTFTGGSDVSASDPTAADRDLAFDCTGLSFVRARGSSGDASATPGSDSLGPDRFLVGDDGSEGIVSPGPDGAGAGDPAEGVAPPPRAI